MNEQRPKMNEQRPGTERFKLLIVGVGGQGVLTSARLLGEAALIAGMQVVVSQMHGMSRRGGSVQASVLIGPGRSPFMTNHTADIVLGLEPLEALRARSWMSARTQVTVNVGRIVPATLAQQGVGYPDLSTLLSEIRSVAPETVVVDGSALLESLGFPRGLNILMLGALAGLDVLPLTGEAVWHGIERRCPPRQIEPNRRAFALGKETVGT
ncbi:MAG: indolepyruvate oxidoreductase subunit beta [Candidatus Krumholzibacteriia bacterium]